MRLSLPTVVLAQQGITANHLRKLVVVDILIKRYTLNLEKVRKIFPKILMKVSTTII